jgi:plastocyanin
MDRRGSCRLLISFAIVISASLSFTVSHGQARTGSIVGRVKLTVRMRGIPIPSPMYPTRTVGRQGTAPLPEIKNVVVYLKDVGFRGDVPAMPAELRQRDETFLPHVVAISKGSSVDFPNEDAFFHNVFSLSGAGTFDLGRYPQNQVKTWRFTKAGLVKVYCHIHSHMSASILVLDHPYFAVPDADGAFELRDVPPGEHTLIGWHERIGEKATSISVEAGRTAVVNLSLPVEDEP